MSPEQCKAARAWLGWSMEELATRAHVSPSTVRDFEAGRRSPHRNRLSQIREALELGGIVLKFGPDGIGIGIEGKASVSQAGAPKVEKKNRET